MNADLLQQRLKSLKGVEIVETSANGKKCVVDRYGNKTNEVGYAEGFVTDTKPDPQLAYVMDGLYVGSQDSALNLEGIKENNVTHILNLVEGIPCHYPEIITYKVLPILDLENSTLESYFEESFAFIEAARNNGTACLVHCNAGVSRSVSIVLAYKMMKLGISFDVAYNELKAIRPAVRPNNGFMDQLKNLHF